MVHGPTSPAEQHAELLLETLGTNRTCVNHYIAQASGIALISGGGSDRQFFRIELPDRNVVLMVSPHHDQEFDTYVTVARFLHSIDVAAPEIYEAFPDKRLLVMEDLGDTSLYSLLFNEKREESILSWYGQVIDLLAHMQVEGRNHWDACPPVAERTFDYGTLRWETDYFRKAFVEEFCSIDLSSFFGLDAEFESLAEKVAQEPLFFMHRDFQSQNLMVHNGVLRIIDFQGARKGLLYYDLASVLKDSYVVLPEKTQQELTARYRRVIRDRGVDVPSRDRFWDLYTLAGMQRTMQALGAFGFLSREKGKTWFEQYMPAGLHHLQAALADRNDFPVLRELTRRIEEKLLL